MVIGSLTNPSRSDRQRQSCKACGRPDYFNFWVPDAIWAAVVPARLARKVVCLGCFDGFAREQGVPYAKHLSTLYFAGDRATFVFAVTTAVEA